MTQWDSFYYVILGQKPIGRGFFAKLSLIHEVIVLRKICKNYEICFSVFPEKSATSKLSW